MPPISMDPNARYSGGRTSLAADNGPLTDAKIRRYIAQGRYGKQTFPTLPNANARVAAPRTARHESPITRIRRLLLDDL